MTATPIAGDNAIAAAPAAVEALHALPGFEARQFLIPQPYSAAFAIDALRLATGAVAPSETVPSLLAQLGWRWVLSQDALDAVPAGYRQWRVMVLSFGTDDAAARYMTGPVLLPPAFAKPDSLARPAGSPADALLLQVHDTIVPLSDPGATIDGLREVLLWRHGRLVVQVFEAGTRDATDLALLARLGQEVDARLDTVPGSRE